ncbi:hypothetical protein [Haloarchaeobius sp. HME9146]|uniref:hypothetical protein n=1 Tax=Haloarchaeobius sp. HME9146 TaxID=2978732 RepID=UPI0021C1EAB1|nr:hypothetical protein [Haloarchaeobius sp. HME9146]MCT9095941.1 hypothetical protein [Haloarchaeobius sp. HME9146]
MNRRRFLATAGAAIPVALAGCVGSDGLGTDSGREPAETGTDPSPTDSTALDSTATDPASGDGYDLVVENVAVYRRTTTAANGVHVDVAADPERQYVVADVGVLPPEDGETAADPPAPTDLEFTVTLDGESYGNAFATEFGSQYATTIAVPVPTGIEPGTGELAVGPAGDGGIRHEFTAAQLARIARVPQFTLESFTVEGGNASARATLEVTNEGDRDGRFMAELGTDYISDTPEVTFEVPAGETVTTEESVSVYAEDTAEVTVVLGWGSTYHRRTVTL